MAKGYDNFHKGTPDSVNPYAPADKGTLVVTPNPVHPNADAIAFYLKVHGPTRPRYAKRAYGRPNRGQYLTFPWKCRDGRKAARIEGTADDMQAERGLVGHEGEIVYTADDARMFGLSVSKGYDLNAGLIREDVDSSHFKALERKARKHFNKEQA